MNVELRKTIDFYETMVSWFEGHCTEFYEKIAKHPEGYTSEFHKTMAKELDENSFAPIPLTMLPANTFVCKNDDNVEVYSLCVYNTDSYVCWIGWPLSNPTINKEDKKGCFSFLFEYVINEAKKNNYKYVFTTSKTPAVEATLRATGFENGDENVNHYLKIIE